MYILYNTFNCTYITESFNWTAQPMNPTPAIIGQDVSLAWQYSLTADELLQSQTQYFLFWKKLNQLTLNYDQIGTKGYLQVIGGLSYQEPRSPRIVIDRDDQATLHIQDVRREDEGTYKIEFILESDGTVVAEYSVNLTVLGKISTVHQLVHMRDTTFSLKKTPHISCLKLLGVVGD